jgi:hypothetical protein
VLVAFFFLGGVALMIPEQTRAIWIGQIWVVVSLGLAALYLGMIRRANKADRLRAVGTPGEAIIKGMTQTGTYINYQPVVKLELEVHPEGLPAYSLRKKKVVPQIGLGQLAIGNALPIHVDPDNRNDIVIDWGERATPGTDTGRATTRGAGRDESEAITQLEKLDELRKTGVLTEAEFQQEKRRVLGNQ